MTFTVDTHGTTDTSVSSTTRRSLAGRSFLRELDLTVAERWALLDQAENRLHTIKAVLVATLSPSLGTLTC